MSARFLILKPGSQRSIFGVKNLTLPVPGNYINLADIQVIPLSIKLKFEMTSQFIQFLTILKIIPNKV